MNEPFLPPLSSKTQVHLFYLLVGNLGIVVPFKLFQEIIPSMDTKSVVISYMFYAKKYFERNGLKVEAVRNVGYRCSRK